MTSDFPFIIGFAFLWFLAMWVFSNITQDYEGYGHSPGLITACILCPYAIPIWLIKYRYGYWGDTYDMQYYSWFNHGKGFENRPKFLLTYILEFTNKYIK